ncbi:hypothetical protein POJ06DRAFT_44524 [Lipomyces tetrasporus]|uniref:Membrane anchor Opy2 N-terminal domain-containing protein n=1 Tax=Lipomyces tetrasporus TaxID=54092 RepID=A0AAD7QKA6_9ASCO|nr:uncharacterized protein POJ06DRAFT_44524 [Lipomyces tetrasporus]KAJ8096799.1 hypothetical protein POJ06DRAFT_44524 [Lipomyces tetrasporus]
MSAIAHAFRDPSDLSRWGSSLIARANCITCPSSLPSCPNCAADEQCQLTLQTCSSCPTTSCVKKYSSGSPTTSPSSTESGNSGSTSTPIGAIVGGTVGGFVFVCAIVALLFFFFRRRRARLLGAAGGTTTDDSLDGDEKASHGPDDTRPRSVASGHYRNDNMAEARQSTHTVASLASSAITRASNVIPIAYIPGVINRSNPNSPSYVPPIPEMPLEHVGQQASIPPSPSTMSVYGAPQQQHVQLHQPYYDEGSVHSPTGTSISDIAADPTRGMSIYSAATYDSQEDQSIRDSVGLRESVATSAYRSTVVVAPAMMTAIRAKPNLIERKS